MGGADLAAAGVSIAYYVHSLSFGTTDDAFIDGHVVPVSSRVSGHVAKVYVEDNQLVNEGDLLAELDPSDFETRLTAADAAMHAAQATGKSRPTGVAAAQADWEQTKAELVADEAREQRADARGNASGRLFRNMRLPRTASKRRRPPQTWRVPM